MTSQSLSSNRILRTTLLWSAAATALLAVIGAVVGYAVAGMEGLWSALVAVVLAAVFLALTGITILVANRWYGDPLYVPIFFGAVMGGWLLKFVLFIVALMLLRGQEWLNPTVFFIALVVSVVASLVIDVIVMTRMRIPHVSDVTLPTAADLTEQDDAEDPGSDAAPEVGSGRES
ncbi:hypothetical protein [Microbacterium invictum]|uniref:Zn-dependent protease with chaperone function n=1 Tax=Microbacterium invictum TaxID=515415 RepID=A0AA40SNV2_9MICO|nr:MULTISPECIES: hypothetical protein [Microbacterium]MBB4139646.1 Zn-dependent protease with chaperone function [Microbacterium invictum]